MRSAVYLFGHVVVGIECVMFDQFDLHGTEYDILMEQLLNRKA